MAGPPGPEEGLLELALPGPLGSDSHSSDSESNKDNQCCLSKKNSAMPRKFLGMPEVQSACADLLQATTLRQY